MKSMMIKIFLFSFYLIYHHSLYACVLNAPSNINLALSISEEKSFSYNIKSASEALPLTVLSNCSDIAVKKKYIMIAMGPEVLDYTDQTRGTNFNRVYQDSRCFINNNPLKLNSTKSDRKKIFEMKWKYINECVEIQITDLGPNKISYPEDQEGCKVKRISDKIAIFNGGYCFFKPGINSLYNVEIRLAKSCQKLDSYKNNGVSLQDINADISYYTSTEYKGDLMDLNALGTSSLRLSTNPILPVLKPSEDFGVLRPLFPAEYPLNDLHLGKIEFHNINEFYTKINSAIITSNFCQETMIDGVKSSPCDYATPVVAEFKLKNEKNDELASWYDGGVASAQWQGILTGAGFYLNKEILPLEKLYFLEVTFSDPYYDFNYFKNRLQSKIRLPHAGISFAKGEELITEITSIPEVIENKSIPEIETITGLNIKGFNTTLSMAREKLNGYFSTSLFPPFYSHIINTETGKVQKMQDQFAKFYVSFYLDKNLALSKLKIRRESILLGPYDKDITDQPENICK
jgi:hypothetical protein